MEDFVKWHCGDNNTILTSEHRNLLSVAFKNVVGAKRSSWRVISSLESKETNPAQAEFAKQYKVQIENELDETCKVVLVSVSLSSC